MDHRFLQLLFLITCIFLRVNGDDCVYQICSCKGAQILCQYRDLTSVPPLTSVRITLGHLMLNNNKITTIPAGSLPSNLTEISLLNNPLTTIDVSAFDSSANTLATLSFSHANLTQIPAAIRHLTALTSLTIYDSDIHEWNFDPLTNIFPTLKTLFLENVGLTTWPSWIQYFNNLKELSIVSSTISNLPDDGMDNVAASLTSLSVVMSSLKSIPKAFSNLKSLQYLQLQNNDISNLTWLPRSNQLMDVSLSNNNISDADHLSNCLRVLEHSLSSVKLTQNKLSAIPDLSYLKKVGSLDFSNNRISDPASGSLPDRLFYLDLRYNVLPSIPVIFFSLPFIKDMLLSSNTITEIRATQIPIWMLEVDLGHNLIIELTDTSFPGNSSLTLLNLMNNPITTISNLAFKNLLQLSNLNLQNTKLTRLPLALTDLINLTYLDVSNDHDLVCTCLEKSLSPWITRTSNHVIGECGKTSVISFFTSLSPDCP